MTNTDKPALFGIDLGTTNSCISMIKDDTHDVISIDGKTTVPSIVAYKDGKLLVGSSAKNHVMVEPTQGVTSIKRKMDTPNFTVQLGNKEMTPIDVSSCILAYLQKQAESITGMKVEQAVITVPAWFNESQRQATISAGKKAGLDVIRIINEPTAAALVFDTEDLSEESEEKWLVYDLGGGTFDVSVINATKSSYEVLATAGNSFLGGDDFDQRLVSRFIAVIRDSYNVDLAHDAASSARLKFIAEKVKIELSTETRVEICEPISYNGESYLLEMTLTRNDFEELIDDLIQSTLEKCRQVMDEADLNPENISRLLLVGGSTRIPFVAQELNERFGITPDSRIDPDLSVSLGASLQAAIATGHSYKRNVVDVCPHTLGIAAVGHEDREESLEDLMASAQVSEYPLTFAPLIRKNTRLPASYVQTFYKSFEHQPQVDVVVLQGESSLTTDNNLIGKFNAKLHNHHTRTVDVRFSYDVNGVIKVSVEEPGQKRTEHSIDLSQPTGSLGHTFDAIEVDENTFLENPLDEGRTEGEEISNYLIDKITQKLSPELDEYPTISGYLAEYKKHLKVGNDQAMDELEEKLYEWLES